MHLAVSCPEGSAWEAHTSIAWVLMHLRSRGTALEAEVKSIAVFAGQNRRVWFSVAMLVKVTLPSAGFPGS